MVVAKKHALRYAITDLLAQGLDRPAAREARLREQVHAWAVDGVDFVQLREKQLESGELLSLARAALAQLGESAQLAQSAGPADIRPIASPFSPATRLLINGRADIAAAAGAHGVHLTAHPGELTPAQARAVFTAARRPGCLVSISCHSPGEVACASDNAADLVLFGPIFKKRLSPTFILPGTGLPSLRLACAAAPALPILALGGVTPENSAACLAAGASGFAGIRLFDRVTGPISLPREHPEHS